ncbi:type II toxin-antitoxin system RelE/ParE family toxin [Geodermatophilus marinus]|uniref:type II toxin-antitoxin system RelE/ParE family toxin n=1 Tax=Geodermatophilus sp. LHW52908 TaxID=2303986 RepID=UPI000E3D313B|nr:type II toxin-antitoxin system RelE/ParE family toxin [Geodermatophilus sp. LHW52908]RFU19666.1 DNA-binding protein [Geodermatophilus sp. LHW52908]
MWEVVLLDEVSDWFLALDRPTANLVAAAIDLLADEGPSLGRPLVDRVKGSSRHNMKELRPGSRGRSEVRILFVFDPGRQAVLLVAGDKAGRWSDWYRSNIPVAEARYDEWLRGERAEET